MFEVFILDYILDYKINKWNTKLKELIKYHEAYQQLFQVFWNG